MLAEFLIKVWKLFGSYVLLNKRRLTGNRPGSARRETGRKKSLPQHPYTSPNCKVDTLHSFDNCMNI